MVDDRAPPRVAAGVSHVICYWFAADKAASAALRVTRPARSNGIRISEYRTLESCYTNPSAMRIIAAEGVGFEPTRACALPVFKTGAINHSTTPPNGGSNILLFNRTQQPTCHCKNGARLCFMFR